MATLILYDGENLEDMCELYYDYHKTIQLSRIDVIVKQTPEGTEIVKGPFTNLD